MRLKFATYHFNRLTNWLLPERWFAALRFRMVHGRWANVKHPQTLAEKMFFCLLYERNQLRPVFANKLAARDYIEQKGYGAHLPRLLGVYDKVAAIDFASLPSRYVIKATHGSGFVRLVSPQQPLCQKSFKHEALYWLNHDYYFYRREWFYRHLPRRLMIEEFIGDASAPVDYKIFIANGRALFIQVDEDRFGDYRRTFYSTDWQRLPFSHQRRTANKDIEKPAPLADMLTAAQALTTGVQFARVDFYVRGNQFYIGEITNFPGAAGAPITPPEWNEKLGELFGECRAT